MSTLILPPSLFPPIHYMALWIGENGMWNVHQKFEKQSWRNRFRILGPNGAQDLSAPINHQSDKTDFSKVALDHTHPWVDKEWKSIETAYRNSSFFEALAPELEPIIKKEHTLLLDRCTETMNWVLQQLRWVAPIASSEEQITHEFIMKSRFQSEGVEYRQVFQYKNPFVKGLSVLDLLMNEGPLALDILETQNARMKGTK